MSRNTLVAIILVATTGVAAASAHKSVHAFMHSHSHHAVLHSHHMHAPAKDTTTQDNALDADHSAIPQYSNIEHLNDLSLERARAGEDTNKALMPPLAP